MATSGRGREKDNKSKVDDAPRIRFVVEGKPVELRWDDIDGLEARDFRVATGFGVRHAFTAAAAGTLDDLELIAGVMWLVTRRDNPKITYEECLSSINYGNIGDAGDTEVSPG